MKYKEFKYKGKIYPYYYNNTNAVILINGELCCVDCKVEDWVVDYILKRLEKKKLCK